MLLSSGRCPGLGAFWAFSPLQPTRRSPRSCCILLFTLQKACYTRSVWFVPAKRLFIVVNVVFVVFPPQQAISERERARLQGSFRSYGEFPLVGAVGGWPVGSPWGSSSSLTQGGWQGQRLAADVAARAVATSRRSVACLGREACRPAPWVSRPACRRPGLRRPWWPS